MSEVIKHTSKLWERRSNEGRFLLFWCPGCKYAHIYEVPRWSFNENYQAPTFAPSLRIFTRATEDQPEKTYCHLHVQDGLLKFCGDCPHEYNGKTIEMQDIPVNYGF